MKNIISVVLLVVICLFTAILADDVITSKKVGTDGLQNFQGAYNLATTGVLSFVPKQAGKPSMWREPLPPALLAVWLHTVFGDIRSADPAKINGKPDVVWVKRQNIVWALIILVGVYCSTLMLSRVHWAALLATALTAMGIIRWSFGLESMYTEPVASALIVWIGVTAISAIQSKSIFASIMFGMLFGCLALTKAVALQVFFIAIIILGFFFVYVSGNLRRSVTAIILMLVSFGVVVGPWIWRNEQAFGEASITMRGGRVLYYRSMINEMPWDTYRASFYVWSPDEVRPVLERVFNFAPSDVADGGPGQWLNRSKNSTFAKSDDKAFRSGHPELAKTYLYQMRGEYVKREREAKMAGAADPADVAITSLKRDAVRKIVSQPLSHVLAMVPLGWQGMWVTNAPYSIWAAPILTASIFVFLGWSVSARRLDAMAFALAPFGFYMIYLASTHVLPRYIEPVTPSLIVFFCTVLAASIHGFDTRRRVPLPQANGELGMTGKT